MRLRQCQCRGRTVDELHALKYYNCSIRQDEVGVELSGAAEAGAVTSYLESQGFLLSRSKLFQPSDASPVLMGNLVRLFPPNL